ncbi:MAG: MgtC/SapB family protein [Gemmobacter sp.]|nr:MgtC/SapB family protein [Gemmobacter sp.]
MQLSDLNHIAIWLPMVASILTGAAIGFERELQAKAAGLRTHTLVCFSSTLLMMGAAQQADWVMDLLPGQTIVTDPARMAHGILTGIGFLGAGVIFRQGSSVQGLTTAASVWMVSALGVLYGAGLFWIAVAGTISTLVVLVLFRMVHWIIPDRLHATVTVTVACQADALTPVEQISAILRKHSKGFEPLARKWSESSGQPAAPELQLASTVWLKCQDDCQALSADLMAIESVTGIVIAPVVNSGQFDWK